MNRYPGQFGLPSQVGVRPTAALSAGFLSQAFTWMFAGLLLTAGIAFVVQGQPRITEIASDFFLPAILVEFGVVLGISFLINRMSAVLALGLFFVYAAINGLTIGLIVSLYTQASVATAFVSAAGMFGAAAVYGTVTHRSLANVGGYLRMALFGLIIAMLVNVFLGSPLINYAISLIGVVIFVGLTAFDTQRIARGDLAVATGSMEKGAVMGALVLYLDFINLFLFLLRLFGGGGNRR
jgi:FtsH-binding integral membrane protein